MNAALVLRVVFQTEQGFERAAHGVLAFVLKSVFVVFGRAAGVNVVDALPHLLARAYELFRQGAAAVVARGAAQGDEAALAVRAEADVDSLALAGGGAAVRALRRAPFENAPAVFA